jgi:DNA-binding winged helix-turn-helix (wHTH) protein
MQVMVQQQEYFLYLGRDPELAHDLRRSLVRMILAASSGPAATAAAPAPEPATSRPSTGAARRNGRTGDMRGNGLLIDELTLARRAAPASAPSGAPTVSSSSGADGLLPLHLAANQKEAQRFVQSHATRLVVVQTTAKPSSRRRFGEYVRQRAPSACIVALGPPADYHFAFDTVLGPVPDGEAVRRLADLVRKSSAESVIARGPVTLNALTRRVTTPKGEFEMTPKQCALLLLLMRHSNRVVSRSDIMRTIWETSYLDDTRTLDVHVHWLRLMIEPDPAQPTLLVTRRGVGYQFVSAEKP